MKLRIKRSLYLVHRWFGVAMCALVAMWFATGIIMMYVEYPELTEEERLATLRAARSGPCHALRRRGRRREQARRPCGDDHALRRRSAARVPPSQRCRRSGRRPRRRRQPVRGPVPASAVAAAQHSGFAADGALATYDGTVDVDQWTVSAVLDEHRPLHRVAIGDDRGTVVYVSDTTGQIVRDTHRTERLWNWLGSTLHWIYPYQLRRHVELWTNLQIFLSVASIVSVATGAVIGVLRLRLRRPYRGRDVSPYAGAAKWHHVLGLVSLVFLATFTFSGLMSMTPWGLFDSASSEAEQVRRFVHGGEGDASAWTDIDAESHGARRRQGSRVAARRGSHARRRQPCSRRSRGRAGRRSGPEALRKVRAPHRNGGCRRSCRTRRSSAPPSSTEYDDYYYSRHNRYRPLPAYRVSSTTPRRRGSTSIGRRARSSCAIRRRPACSAGSTTGCTASTSRSCAPRRAVGRHGHRALHRRLRVRGDGGRRRLAARRARAAFRGAAALTARR